MAVRSVSRSKVQTVFRLVSRSKVKTWLSSQYQGQRSKYSFQVRIESRGQHTTFRSVSKVRTQILGQYLYKIASNF